MRITGTKRGCVALGAVVLCGLLLLVGYGALIELNCRRPWRVTDEVRARVQVGMTLQEVLAVAREVEGAEPAVAWLGASNGLFVLHVASGFECQCQIPLQVVSGRVSRVWSVDLD